jgi:glucose-1-phosphate adenylyltransferase
MKNILANVLVGGKRTELSPLVEQRCKAAVPVFGKYRIIDFTLSNLINSNIRKINVIVQYMYDSLQKHIRDGWNFLPHIIGEYIDVYPPQQREGERWYQGTADAIYQNLFSIETANPDYILIIHGDHVTTVDYNKIINHHMETDADLTMATIYIEPEWAGKFGNINVDEINGKLVDFFEKPGEPKGMTDKEGNVLINAGVYLFKTKTLIEELRKDNKNEKSEHNISKNIIPQMLKEKKKIMTYHYQTKEEKRYNWHFFLNLDHYYKTNMNILKPNYKINPDSEEWPIRTVQHQNPPTFVNNDIQGEIINCSIGSGGEIKGSVKNSILGNNVIIEKGAIVEDSIIFNNVTINKGAKIKKSILDKEVFVEENHTLGHNFESDKNTFHTTEEGIVVIGKGRII